MNKQISPPTKETQALKKAYRALNRGDIPMFMEIFDPEIERVEPDGFAGSGTYRGLDSVSAHFLKSRENWAEGSCEPERFVVAGNHIVVLVHVRVRLKDETDWREGRVADVYTFREGRAIHFQTFIDQKQALEFAGVEV